VDLADFVHETCVVEDPLRGCGLAGINVGSDADVPCPLER